MSEQSGSGRYLVTGGLGFVGAWVVRHLARENCFCVAADLDGDSRRLDAIIDADDRPSVVIERLDVTQPEAVLATLERHDITHVIHLAGLQVPQCRERPVLGAEVNVVGFVNVMEAARRHGLRTTIAYASSAAAADAEARSPSTLYGVFKLADEGVASVYWTDHDVASVGLRPACIYGPGRDVGITAAVTTAIEAAARRESFHIPFGDSLPLHWAGDVAHAFVSASRTPPTGATVRIMPSERNVSMTELVQTIDRVRPGASALLSVAETRLGFSSELAGTPLQLELTPLDDGIRQCIEHVENQR